MKKIIFLILFAFFAITAHSQLLAPKGLKIGKDAQSILITKANTTDGTTIGFYNNNTLLSPLDPDTVNFSTYAIIKSDSSNVVSGSYTTRYDFKTEPTKMELIKVMNKYGAGIKITGLVQASGAYTGSANQMVDQRASYILTYVTDTVTVSTLYYQMHTAGNYTTDGSDFNGMAIYSISGTTATRIAITANTPTVWTTTANTLGSIALTAPVTLVPGIYYIGFMYNYLAQTAAPYIVGSQPGTIYTSMDLSNNMRLGIFYSSVTSFPASFTISSANTLGILHNFIGR